MKRYRFSDLPSVSEGHVLSGVLPGRYLNQGGLGFKAPGERTHTNDGPDNADRHVHADAEAFVILQGKGAMEINGVKHSVTTGDVIIVEPGEDHHLISDVTDPCVNLWFHAGETSWIGKSA